MKRNPLQVVRKATKGPTTMSTGVVLDRKAIGCPDVDTIFLRFHRDGEGDTTIYLTPDEASIISDMLEAAVYGGRSL